MAVKGIWRLPFRNHIDAAKANQEVCVVGVFGKSTWGHTSKNCVINRLTRTHDFPMHNPGMMKDEGDEKKSFAKFMPKIEAYFDEENRIVYLHLISIFDAAMLYDIASFIGNGMYSHKSSHDTMKNHEIGHLFGLVYLFSVCHMLMLVHPVSQFDVSYDRLFQRVASLRTKLVPVIKDVLKDCNVGRDWWVNGRPCPPRLLLVFQRCHLPTTLSKQTETESKTLPEPGVIPKRKKPPVKRLQHTMEDQVYRILRSSRVLTNNAVNCLFSVPPNQAFVHIMTEEFDKIEKEEDPITGMFDLLMDSFNRHRNPNAMSRAKQLLVNAPKHWIEDYMTEEERKGKEAKDGGNSIRSFVFQHTSLVLDKKGFNDSIGRNPMPSHFELPTLKTWLKVANGLYHLLLTDEKDLGPGFENSTATKKDGDDGKTVEDLFTKVSSYRQYMRSKLDIEMKFSEARCSKVLPMAIAVYQNSLPSHYTSKVHNNQLTQALLTYNQHARGPATEKYRDQLKSECMTFWGNGRQLCEVRSLTDRHCVHRYHILAQPNSTQDPDADPPILFHASRSRSTATSSCGTIQGMRDDPFDLKEANYDFYVILDKKAHSQPMEAYPFPVYQPGDESSANPNHYLTDCTASFSSQILSTDHPEYRSSSMGLQQSTSIPTQEDDDKEKEERQQAVKVRSRNISEGVTETEDFDNPISTQGSADVKENAETSSQELSQGKEGDVPTSGSPRKSPKKDRLESEGSEVGAKGPTKESKGHASVNLSFALSLGGHSEGSVRTHSPIDHNSQRENAGGDQEQSGAPSQKHIISKEEIIPKVNFIDGMIHNNCKKGVLPLYSSWSLVKIGSYSHYMAIRGLQTPGFLSGTNFLVPWDIPIERPKDDVTQWPAPSEAQGQLGKKILSQVKEQKSVLGRRNKDDPNTVRAFIGYEYETLRGQRFICSGPDKPVKVTNSGTVKDSCHKLLESDMPLYTPSPASGRSGKTLLGQLMRAYIVIPPESSIEITVNPHVIPGPPPTPTFTSGVPDIPLSPDSIWVLRFPYVYKSDLGPHYIPKDGGLLQMCKLLKGMVKLNKK